MVETGESGVDLACGVFLGARIGVLTPVGYGTIERRLAVHAFKV